MMSFLKFATVAAARLLPSHLQEAALGDLEESNASALSTFSGICQMLFYRELGHWRSWQPWMAAVTTLTMTLLLLAASFGLSMRARPAFSDALAPMHWTLFFEALLLLSWAWTSGFMVASLARQTAWVSVIVCAIPCLSCLLRFREPSLSRYHVLLFLAPALFGAFAALRLKRPRTVSAVILALVTTALMLASNQGAASSWLLLAPPWFLVLAARPFDASNATHGRGTLLSLALLLIASTAAIGQSNGRLVTREIHSACFATSKIQTDPVRKLVIYLPPGYDSSGAKRYPVLYFFPNPMDSTFRDIFDKRHAQTMLDAMIQRGAIKPMLFVIADMTTPLGSSWYVNSLATGNWEDFVTTELVPYVDGNFRTLASRDSRGIAGHFMGGYGAIRLAMEHPELFGAVYALHPVGTGNGVKVLAGLPNLDAMENAKSLDDVRKDGYSQIFTTIFEAHVPNADRPPLFIDLPAHRVNSELAIDAAVMDRLRKNFFLEELVGKYANNLKSLRGFKFDWARSDLNWDHVFSNQAFTHTLNEYGVQHEAEEYNGMGNGDPNWSSQGRVPTEMLPFFAQHLVF